jgi:VanZ family protein
VLVVLHALMDEYHQSFTQSRSGSLYDSGIDVAGGLIGLIGFSYLRRRSAGNLKSGLSGHKRT